MFVVCGEALIDMFAAGPTATGLAIDARVGGSPFNVAVGLARLGQPVAFLASLSTDFLGDRLVQALHDEGVATACVQRVAAPTTLSVVGVDAGGAPSYAFYGDGAADRRLDGTALETLPPAARVVQFGSFAMVEEPVGSTLRALVERVHGERLVAYDPNVRLNVEPRLERWHALFDWMLPRCDLLKISDEDAALLYPGIAPAALAGRWLAAGVALVVITRGRSGAAAWTTGAHAVEPAAPVDVVDTVGAGDSFQAALLAWLAEHDRLTPAALRALDVAALADALRFAGRAAALTCSRRGADLPRRDALG